MLSFYLRYFKMAVTFDEHVHPPKKKNPFDCKDGMSQRAFFLSKYSPQLVGGVGADSVAVCVLFIIALRNLHYTIAQTSRCGSVTRSVAVTN